MLIDIDVLKRIAVAASTDRTRPNLRGVGIDCEGELVRLCATDGHRLICAVPVKWEGSWQRPLDKAPAIFPADRIKTLALTLKGCPTRSFVWDPKTGALRCEALEMEITAVVGEFPQWDQVVPAATPDNVPNGIGINARYLWEFQQAAYGRDASVRGCSLRTIDDLSPIVIGTNGRIDPAGYMWHGAIMPVKL